MVDKPGAPTCTVREHPAEASVHEIFNSHLLKSFDRIMKETGDIEFKWTMFSTFIAEAAALCCCCNVVGKYKINRKKINRNYSEKIL